MNNAKIADVFDELADLLELKGENPFRIRAYRNGAKAVRELDESIASILADSSRKLEDVPGIGKTMAEKSQVLLDTGSLPQLEDLREAYPAGVLQMVRVPGLGAKKAAALHRELGVETLDQLRDACNRQQVRKLKGFGAKTEQTILEGLEIAQAANERLRWVEADRIVHALLEHMQALTGLEQIQPAGSYRRGRETVGDVDLLVVAQDRTAAMDHFEAFPGRADTIARGDTKVSIRVGESFQVDMRVVEAEQFGAALQYFTGSKEHNVRLRGIAKKRGLKINEYGVFKDDDEASIAGKTEAEVYEVLGMPCFPPEIREDRFEFGWAESGTLPELISIDQIRGDLHMHTTATDGQATIREMADAAIERGLGYIAITDHSKRVAMAGGLDAEALREQWKMIDQIRPEYEGRLQILKGIECDILENGEMDLDEAVLMEGDWIIASVHYGQKQSRQQLTDRICGALEHPAVSIVAHPTGRLINRRAAYDVDIEAVVQAAAQHGKCLELNANPARLDLNDLHLMLAKRHGVPIVISTDAHSTEGLDVMRHGIQQARRGGLTAADVANTRAWAEMDPRGR
ncbi:DNA polymerase/3'-5' exonuclease PolX [Roseimaritima sediminicola]|uniref:DNA polymerase/3'-5' exonuclease PolX n=1 Tax=Roseimaritima sediminicola TaxID=2662066 RepID=UPI0012984D23|nr:DNA polymerase/3'-5' exonuclease PolX [Roseimaritima sediminicola]